MFRAIVLRVLVALGLPECVFSPFFGLLFYLWYSHARPNDFLWPGYSFANGAYLIAIATFLGYILFEIRRSPPRWKGLKLLTLFWVWIALASLFATNPDLALPKVWQFTHIFAIVFLIVAMANSESRIRSLLYVLGGSIGFLGAKGALDLIVTGGQARMAGPGGLEAEENEYALALNMAIPILFGLASRQEHPFVRWALRGVAIGCAMTVIGTHSRSGLLGLGFGALLLTIYSKRKLIGVAALLAAALVFLRFVPPAALERYATIPTASATDPSAIGRLQAWETAMLMVKAHPYFGVGPLNFVSAFPLYSSYTPRAPHNAFMALLAESGIPSCLLFVGVVGSAICQMWWLRRKLSHDPRTADLATYCLIIQITLSVYIVPNLFINRQNQDLMYHLVGISAGLARLAKRRLAEQHADISASEHQKPELALVLSTN